MLGVALVVALSLFFATFEIARSYYSPETSTIIVLLGVLFLLVSVLSKYADVEELGILRIQPLRRLRDSFAIIFALTFLTLVSDVVLTLYAVSRFGLSVETNTLVVGLIRRGAVLAWFGQEFGPIVITGIAFGMTKNVYFRTILAFFALATFIYALSTVMNDVSVLRNLVG